MSDPTPTPNATTEPTTDPTTGRPHPGGIHSLGGRPVARIGYGARHLEKVAEADAVALLHRAVELGVDLVDTAPFYGDGVVDRHLRAAFTGRWDEVAISTKVGAMRVDAPVPLAPAQRPEQLRAQIEAELALLGVDRVDHVLLRRLDIAPGIAAEGDQIVPIEDQLAELIALRDAGTIGVIGLGNATTANLEAALPAGIGVIQNADSVLTRPTDDQFAIAAAHGIAWMPYFPLGTATPAMPRVDTSPEVRAVAERIGATPAQVALAWMLQRTPHVLLIAGTSDIGHLEENLGVADLVLDADAVAVLDAVGTRGEALPHGATLRG